MRQNSSMEIDSLCLPLHVTAIANFIRGLLARPHLFVMHLSTAWALPYDDSRVLTKSGWDDSTWKRLTSLRKLRFIGHGSGRTKLGERRNGL